MGDRRPLFPFWLWSSATTQAAATLPAATPAPTATVDPQNGGAIAKGPFRYPSNVDIAIITANTPPPPVFPSPIESTASSPKTPTSGNVQIAIINSPFNEPRTPSPSSLPGSSFYWTPESQSPPSSSLSQMASKTHSTPKWASPSHLTQGSPKQVSNDSPKGVQPISPSKEPKTTTQEISGSSDYGRQNSEVSKQESQLKPDSKHDGDNAIKGQDIDGTNFKHETTTEENRTVKREHTPPIELEVKPQDVKEGKEVVQEKIAEANEEIKKEACEFFVPESGNKAQINEKTSSASSAKVKPANTMSQPKKRSMGSDARCKPDLPGGDHFPLQNDIRNYISKFIDQMATKDLNSSICDKHISLITLSGENKGASMQLGSKSSETEDPLHNDETIDATPDRDGISAEKRIEDANTTEDQPEAYVNNNAQGVNNSIVFDGSITERNPGVHMVVVTHVPKEPIQLTDKTSPIET